MAILKERAARNRTVTLSDNEIDYYAGQCCTLSELCPQYSPIDKVICGDMFETADKLPDAFVDLLIADPPYNLSKTYGDTSFNSMSGAEYAEFKDSWITAVKHTLKPDASVYICCDWKSSLIIGSVIQNHFYVQNRITWQREKGRGAKRNWKNSMEDIWFATVSPKNYTFNIDDVKIRRRVIAPYRVDGQPKDWFESEEGNFRDTCPSNFWDDISVPYWSMPENTDHPAQKPEKLIAKLVLSGSNIGDLVFDPFLGSGTSAVVAKKLGRRFLGIEREREYCALTQKRLETAEFDTEIQGYKDGVFWERNTLALQQKYKSGGRAGQLSLELPKCASEGNG